MRRYVGELNKLDLCKPVIVFLSSGGYCHRFAVISSMVIYWMANN